MRKSVMCFCGLCLVLVLATSPIALAAQGSGKAGKKTDLIRRSGRVVMVSKDVMVVGTKDGQIQIKLDDKTHFTYRNKPASIDEVKEGRRVICLTRAGEKNEIIAARVDVREGK